MFHRKILIGRFYSEGFLVKAHEMIAAPRESTPVYRGGRRDGSTIIDPANDIVSRELMIADKKPWDGSYMQSSRLKNARRHLQPVQVKQRSSRLRG